MDLFLKIALGLLAALFLVMGASWALSPASAAAGVELALEGPVGFNTARGDIGGLFLALFAMILLGLTTRGATWFQAAALLLACIAAGRSLGLLMDGVAQGSLSALGAEIVMIAVLLAAAKRAAPAADAQAA